MLSHDYFRLTLFFVKSALFYFGNSFFSECGPSLIDTVITSDSMRQHWLNRT